MEKPGDPPTFDWTPPSKPRQLLTRMSGVLGCVLVFGLCGVGIWAVDNVPDRKPAPTGEPTLVAAASTAAEDLAETLGTAEPGLGSPVRHGALEYLVTGQRCGIPKVGAGSGAAGEPIRGQFCLVTITVRNLGRGDVVLTASDQVGYDPTGTRYLGSAPATRYANGSSRAFLTAIPPGSAVSGTLAFDLPKGLSLRTLRLRSSVSAGSVAITLA